MTKRSALTAALSFTLAAAFLVGSPAVATSLKPTTPLISAGTGLPVGEMPTAAQRVKAQAALAVRPHVTPHLTYYDGPVISNASVVSVLWGPGDATQTYLPQVNTNAAPNFDGFFGHVTNSAYQSWLSEYNTAFSTGTGQNIGYGNFVGRYTLPTQTSATTNSVVMTTVDSVLNASISAGNLPAPTFDAQGYANTVYAVFFPKNVVVKDIYGNASGAQFCAIHGSFARNNVQIPYILLPDTTTPAMVGGCGAGTAFQNLEGMASHEYVEAVTDPDVAAASLIGPPMGWYDPQGTDGEIGDICNQQMSTVLGTDSIAYGVQKEWSNTSAACIAQKSTTAPGSSEVVTATAKTVNGTPGVHLSWTLPSDGGSAITSWQVLQSDGIGGYLAPLIASGSATSYDIGGLTPGQSYQFSVAAVNVYGIGNPASPVTYQSATAPSTPTNLVATPGLRSVGLTWSAASSDGGSALTGYNVYRFDATNPTGLLIGSSPTGSAFYTDSSATPGTPYTYAVTATNAIGESAQTQQSAAVAAQDVPGPPINVAVEPVAPGSVTVTWTAPTNDGGSALTDYSISRSEDPSNVGVQVGDVQVKVGNTFTDTGLTAGQTEYYTVYAGNKWGLSATGVTVSVTVGGLPAAPTIGKVTPANKSVTVHWSAPADTGSLPLTGYQVKANSGSHGCIVAPAVTSCVITGLTNGTAYKFRVLATNSVGSSLASSPSATVTPRTVPGAPTSLRATYANGHKTTVSWSRPASNGGANISAYYVRWSPDGSAWTSWVNVGTKMSATHIGFAKGHKAYVEIEAANVAGRSPLVRFALNPSR